MDLKKKREREAGEPDFNKKWRQRKSMSGKEFIKNALTPIIKYFICALKISTPGLKNVDYGNHSKTLNFSPEVIQRNTYEDTLPATRGETRYQAWLEGKTTLPNGKAVLPDGSHSFGLVGDKKSHTTTDVLAVPTNSDTKDRLLFLQELKSAIVDISKNNSDLLDNRKITAEHLETLRLNIVKGASTRKHTDVLRHSMLPNFAVFFSPKPKNTVSFQLNISTWPNFKCSFVKLQDKWYIPFEYNEGGVDEEFDYHNGQGGYLKMIGLGDDQKSAEWFIFHPNKISELEPLFKMKGGFAVAGIKDGKVYIISDYTDYKIYSSWKEVPLKGLLSIFQDSVGLPDEKPKKTVIKKQHFGQLVKFYGWRNVHWVESGSNLDTIRLHIFFRNIRTVGVCQNGKNTSKNVTIFH